MCTSSGPNLSHFCCGVTFVAHLITMFSMFIHISSYVCIHVVCVYMLYFMCVSFVCTICMYTCCAYVYMLPHSVCHTLYIYPHTLCVYLVVHKLFAASTCLGSETEQYREREREREKEGRVNPPCNFMPSKHAVYTYILIHIAT